MSTIGTRKRKHKPRGTMKIEASQLEAMAQIISSLSAEVKSLETEMDTLKASSDNYYKWWQESVAELKKTTGGDVAA